MSIQILVADDEKSLLDLLRDILIKQDYEVTAVEDGEQAINLFFEGKVFDLVILDVMMPKADGWEVCQVIREQSDVPILMLTALSDVQNEIKGLDKGANDYIGKPFSYELLLARVKALLRNKIKSDQVVLYEGLAFNSDSHEVQVDGERVDLRPKEFDLLQYLIQNRTRALSRTQILNHVWGHDYYGDARTVDTHVKSLRAKIGKYGAYIETVRGIGYKLV